MSQFKSGGLTRDGYCVCGHPRAQQPAVMVDDDDITIRGCVREVDLRTTNPSLLVWSRSDLMLVGAEAAGSDAPNPIRPPPASPAGCSIGSTMTRILPSTSASRSKSKAISKTSKRARSEIDQDGAFTKIEIKLDSEKRPHACRPRGLVCTRATKAKFEIVARRVDVDDVRVLGACTVR